MEKQNAYTKNCICKHSLQLKKKKRRFYTIAMYILTPYFSFFIWMQTTDIHWSDQKFTTPFMYDICHKKLTQSKVAVLKWKKIYQETDVGWCIPNHYKESTSFISFLFTSHCKFFISQVRTDYIFIMIAYFNGSIIFFILCLSLIDHFYSINFS